MLVVSVLGFPRVIIQIFLHTMLDLCPTTYMVQIQSRTHENMFFIV